MAVFVAFPAATLFAKEFVFIAASVAVATLKNNRLFLPQYRPMGGPVFVQAALTSHV